jgi:hypothetical protein
VEENTESITFLLKKKRVMKCLRVLYYAHFTPVIFRDRLTGAVNGTEHRLIQSAALAAGIPASNLIFESFDRFTDIFQAQKLKTYHLLAAGMDYEEQLSQRSELYRKTGFSLQFQHTPSTQSLLVTKTSSIFDYSDLQTYHRVGAVPGTAGMSGILQVSQPAKVLPIHSDEEALQALKSGAIDAFARGNVGNEFVTSRSDFFRTVRQVTASGSLAIVGRHDLKGTSFAHHLAHECQKEMLVYKLSF